MIDHLDALTTVTLACAADNAPWAAAVYYARDEFDLVFFSSPTSRHSTVFAQNPRASAAVHGNYKDWTEIKGLQMEGRIEQIGSVMDKAKALAVFLKKYPFVKRFLSDPAGFSADVAKKTAGVALYFFRPSSIYFVNNEFGFGSRWKMEFREGKPVGVPFPA
ncbi:MAG: pyridoxamine 5'-phosphate oxidase family protein [Pseudomonadota bacterium]